MDFAVYVLFLSTGDKKRRGNWDFFVGVVVHVVRAGLSEAVSNTKLDETRKLFLCSNKWYLV